jgi:hypothetical protein
MVQYRTKESGQRKCEQFDVDAFLYIYLTHSNGYNFDSPYKIFSC